MKNESLCGQSGEEGLGVIDSDHFFFSLFQNVITFRSSRKSVVGGELADAIFPRHFLQFHPAVLEPDLDLSVRQVDAFTDL